MKWLVALGMMLVTAAAHAAPALVVEDVAGKVLVRAVAAKLAAWRPASDVLVVVIPAGSGEVTVGDVPAGVKVETLAQGNLSGVVVRGVDGSWQVVQDGAKWLIRPGAGLKAESVMMLRDGWRVGGQTVVPQSLTAAGKTWQVGLVDSARSVAGSVAGVVKLGGAVAVTEAVSEEPAKVAIAPAEAKPVPDVKIVKESAPALKPMAVGTGRLVAMESAAPLKPLGQPVMAASVLPVRQSAPAQGMKVVGMDAMLARIEPASGPAPAAPRSLPVQAAGVLPVEAVRIQPASGLGKVAVISATGLPPIGQGKVVEDLLPQVLGDIYLPGTLVSLTLPRVNDDQHVQDEPPAATVEEMVAAVHEPVAEAPAVSMTAQAIPVVSRTWNQITLAPIEAALAAAEASATAKVEPPHAAPEPVQAAVDEPVVKEPEAARLLPVREGVYQDELAYMLQAIAEAPENSTRERDARMALAGFYLAWERPEEAISVLGTLPKRSDKLPSSPQARLYMALAQLARGVQPPKGLLDQGGTLASHAKLWQAVAASRIGDFAGALDAWPQERGILPQYPAYLREMAQLAQAQALVMVGDRKVAQQVIDQLREGYERSGRVPVGLTRLAGLARLGTPDEQQGLEFLAKAAEDMSDPAEAYRAKFQFVRALQQRRDLSDEQVRTYLTDLWFDWRGDELERDVLDMLGDLYDKAGEPRQALQYWQTLVRAYPDSPDLGRITERMTNAFLKVFDPENPKTYDPLEYVGMYYDFSELVPNDSRGDIVQEQIARILVDANLWKRAVPILETQLRYRPLDVPAQGRLSLLLARAYSRMGEAGEGIKVIDKWQTAAATSSVLAKEWKLVEADLLLQLKRPKTVTKELAAMPADDSDVRDRRIQAAWDATDWGLAIPLLEDKLKGVPAAQLVNDTGLQLALLQLGYAYGQTRDMDKLEGLEKRFSGGLKSLPKLADGLGSVAAGTGLSSTVVGAGALQPITTALSNVNRLVDRVELTRNDISRAKQEQQEYNDKMRYMELLPPPTL